MTPRQLQVLEVIRKGQPISRGAIAKALNASPLTIGVHLAAVKAAGAARNSSRGRDSLWTIGAAAAADPKSPMAGATDIFSLGSRMGAT